MASLNKVQFVAIGTTQVRQQAVRLPLAIGASGDCDVILNAGPATERGYLLTAAEGELRLFRRGSGEPLPASLLKDLGLSIRGPLSGDAATITKRQLQLKLALYKERQLVRALPSGLSFLVGGDRGQSVRLLLVGALTVATVGFLALHKPSQGKVLDLAREPIPVAFDSVRTEYVGANPNNPKVPPGYEHGATLAIDVPENVSGAALVTFRAAGLNVSKGLVLKLNDRVIWESSAEAECVQDYCAKSVRLGPGMLKAGVNLLAFEHHNVENLWFVSRFHLRSLPPMQPIEGEEIRRLLTLAQRAYDERSLVTANLVTAMDLAAQAEKLAGERDQSGDYAAKAMAIRSTAEDAFKAAVAELWRKVQVALQLDRKTEAKTLLTELLQLFPDPTSAERVRISEALIRLEGNMK